MIEVKLDAVAELLVGGVVTDAGNAGCTTDVPNVRGMLAVEDTIEVADVVVAAKVGDDAPT